MRIVSQRSHDGRTVEGYRVYHLDIGGRMLEITEQWGEVETAKRTIALDANLQPLDRAPQPTPGGRRAAGKRGRVGAPEEVQPVRRALDGLAVHDADAVQGHLMAATQHEIVRTGELAPTLIFLCEDHLEEAKGGAGSPLPAMAGAAARRDVVWRVVQGQLVGEGASRTAFVYARANGEEENTWWFGSSTFERLPGGLGMPKEKWDVMFGSEAVPPVPELVVQAFGEGGREWALLPAAPIAQPEIAFGVGELPPGARAPTDPMAAVEVAAAAVEKEYAAMGMLGVAVVVFRGRTVEHWQVRGDPPSGIDDLVRAIAAQGDPPSAVALVSEEPVRIDQTDLCRGIVTVGEAGGRRFRRILAQRHTAEMGDARPATVQLLGEALPDPGADAWIGIPPITELTLTALGMGESSH